ncbi:MAG: phosphodiester glycosidase family protein [Clostridia bacterium]|nr:phosphodiester glycosidase family protein [Clostridia bacterium]
MRKTSSHITDEQAENIIKIFDSFNGNYNDIDDSENNPVSNESDSGYSENYSQNNESKEITVKNSTASKSAASAKNLHNNVRNTSLKILSIALMILIATWLLPSANVMNLEAAIPSSKDRDAFFQMSSQNLLSDALKDVHVIPRKYILELSETLTPAPDESKFEEKYDDERQNFDGKPIYYYKDDSIEVKCWREEISGKVFNFSEVWISDPSQLRRTLVDNVISKKHLDHPQNIFAKTNGVVGMSADFCAFRNLGIIIQYGQVIRGVKNSILDIAVYDKNGNFSAYEDNDSFYETDAYKNGEIIHTFAFGPVLVDNYAVSDSYKLRLRAQHPGELRSIYPRAAICQFDYDKHYLLCTLDYEGMNGVDFATVLQSKGVRFAYNLDGGQTATLLFHKKIINKVAYGGTRQVSDILFFATAIPNE